MWDRSYRWQRFARVTAGCLAVGALIFGAAVFSQTPAAERASAGVSEISREMTPAGDSLVVAEVPSDLSARRGVLVHREGEQGKAAIVGRVIGVEPAGEGLDRITILLTPEAAGAMANGGKVRGAKPTMTVEHAFRLIISPDIPREEGVIARDTLWPAIEEHVLPGLKERVTKELTESFDDLDAEDAALLDDTIKDLRVETRDLEEKLINRLANRAWEVIGVGGVAEGVLRKAGDGASNTYSDVKNWVESWWSDDQDGERANRDFLSKEKAQALRIALEEEVQDFIEENDTEIKRAFNKVLNERRAEFVRQFETKWGPKLYEKALVPSWFEGEAGVLEAAEVYANDFARRRLLTSEGGPRLLLAYALRTSLDITRDPLIVIEPSRIDIDGRVEFEWIMPRLAKDGG